MTPTDRVRVELGPRSYDVRISPGALDELGAAAVQGARRPTAAIIVVDSNLPAATLERARASLAHQGLRLAQVHLRATEPDKSLAAVESILSAMTMARLDRVDPLVALGGGIVGDIAGFAAAIYRRGVPFVQCPTTLLSMVDASVGGKTGANIREGSALRKNMIGAFWQPRAVLADVTTLQSLPPRELLAGLAECLKHALIAADWGDPELLEFTLAAGPRVRALEAQALVELIARNVAIKARVVGQDEREEDPAGDGGRALLNLGHTYAHAMETLPGLTLDTGATSPILHGEAVSLGLVAAASAAKALGVCDASVPTAVSAAAAALGLPRACSGLPDDAQLLAAMQHDKKVQGGVLRLILPTTLGRARVVESPDIDGVRAGWSAIRLPSSK